jgi:hypothetical protein
VVFSRRLCLEYIALDLVLFWAFFILVTLSVCGSFDMLVKYVFAV